VGPTSILKTDPPEKKKKQKITADDDVPLMMLAGLSLVGGWMAAPVAGGKTPYSRSSSTLFASCGRDWSEKLGHMGWPSNTSLSWRPSQLPARESGCVHFFYRTKRSLTGIVARKMAEL